LRSGWAARRSRYGGGAKTGLVAGWAAPTGPDHSSAGLSGVTAIAAGGDHSLALKSNGTVVAWGSNDVGQTDVPAAVGRHRDLSRLLHSLALKSNGTVVAWGSNYYGQTNVPAGLSGVIAIAAGYYHSWP